LCRFLGVAVPDTPFPNVNDRASMLRQIRVLRWTTRAAPWLLVVAIVGVLLALM
jgi:hypothetical protein